MNLRKKIVSVAILAGVAAASATAVAYWTESGSGSGTATSGSTDPAKVKVNQTSTIAGLFPGGSPLTLSGNFDNTNDGPVKLGSVTHSIASIVPAQADTSKPACLAADFALAGSAVVNAEVPKGTSQGAWSGLTIQLLNDSLKNQDNCKNVTVNLTYAVSPAA